MPNGHVLSRAGACRGATLLDVGGLVVEAGITLRKDRRAIGLQPGHVGQRLRRGGLGGRLVAEAAVLADGEVQRKAVVARGDRQIGGVARALEGGTGSGPIVVEFAFGHERRVGAGRAAVYLSARLPHHVRVNAVDLPAPRIALDASTTCRVPAYLFSTSWLAAPSSPSSRLL